MDRRRGRTCYVLRKPPRSTPRETLLFDPSYDNEPEEFALAKSRAFSHCLKQIETVQRSVVEASNEKRVCQITECIHSVAKEWKLKKVKSLHTVIVQTGWNTADHRDVFSQIDSILRRDYFVASLNGPQCPTLRAALRFLLEMWGGEEKKYNSLSSLSSISGETDLFVLVMEELRSFDTSVLGDLFHVLSNTIEHIPICVVVGIPAEQTVTLETIIPSHVSPDTVFRTFSLEKPEVLFDSLLEKVYFLPDTLSFRIGRKVARQLWKTFRVNEGSIFGVVSLLKILLGDHMAKQPLSFLLPRIFGDWLKIVRRVPGQSVSDVWKERIYPIVVTILRHMEHEHVEAIRRTMAFREVVEKSRSKKRKKLLTDDDLVIRTILAEWIFDTVSYEFERQCAAQSYFYLIDLCGEGSERRLDLLLSEEKMADQVDVFLKGIEGDEAQESWNKIVDFYSGVDGESADFIKTNEQEEIPTKRIKRSSRVKKKTGLTIIREILVEFFHDHVRSFFVDGKKDAPKRRKIPALYDMLICNDDTRSYASRTYDCNYRSDIFEALENPHRFKDDISSSMNSTWPEQSIVYTLCAEASQTFRASVLFEDFVKVNTDSNESRELLQARFLSALSDLQHIGFIRPRDKKKEVFVRLLNP